MRKIGKYERINYQQGSADFTDEEIKIASVFEKEWYITFARTQQFKRQWYSFFFVYPGDKIVERFHMDDTEELLILLDETNNFNERSLDFVDKIISEYRNRLETRKLILVSADEKIREKIGQLTNKKQEMRLILPYHFNEFSNYSDNIWERLNEQFYGRDLFGLTHPLKTDLLFFGRVKEVTELYEKYRSGQNGGFFGLRRIGKTSVVFALIRKLKLEGEFGFRIDCEEPAFHRRRWYEALQFIIRSISLKLKEEQNLSITSPVTYTEKDASIYFQQDLREIYEKLGEKRILLIFDEIEKITFDTSPTEHWRNGEDFVLFWQTIRSINENNEQLFSYIMAGTNPRITEVSKIKDWENPIYRAITPMYLSSFNYQQVKEMVSIIGNLMGLDFDEEIYTYLVEEYGGHPFLIRQVCSLIHHKKIGQRPLKVSKFFYEQNRNDFNSSLNDYVKLIVEILKISYPNEYKLLGLLAVDNYENFMEEAKLSESLIQHLLGYKLVSKQDGRYYLTIKSLSKYLAEEFKIAKKLDLAEEQWSYITEERGKLETKLRRLIKSSLLLKEGKAKGLEKFLQIIPTERRTKVQVHNFDEILSGISEIYFLDLKNFIVKNWTDYEKVFQDKSKFESDCDIINMYRIDAHAKPALSQDIFNELKKSLSWLNSKTFDF